MLLSNRACVALAIAALALVLVGCKEQRPRSEIPMWQRPPATIDAATQTYRFMDGRCRSLARIPPPWRLQPPDELPPFFNREINLEADSAAFGIAPPAKNRRTGKDQWIVSITLGTDDVLPDPADPQTDSLWRILYGTYFKPLGEPVPARWPLPEGFKAYMHPSGSGEILYYDPQRRMIVQDDEVERMPNGWITGVMWLSDREAIGFRIPYEALARLDVLADSFEALPDALIVPCPAPPAAQAPAHTP